MQAIQTIFHYTTGQGPDLVLLHGWGVNGGVWDSVLEELSQYWRVTCIDLPGFGRSHDILPASFELNRLCSMVEPVIPSNAVLLGWSLGGLLATNIVLRRQVPVAGLINVASSPKFVTQGDWRGIDNNILKAFAGQLEVDYQRTLERFLAIQAMGSESARADSKALRQAVLGHPPAALPALVGGLQLLQNTDLRALVADIPVPVLNCYGKLDTLVPARNITNIEKCYRHSHQQLFEHSSHAPFITEKQQFLQVVNGFCR